MRAGRREVTVAAPAFPRSGERGVWRCAQSRGGPVQDVVTAPLR